MKHTTYHRPLKSAGSFAAALCLMIAATLLLPSCDWFKPARDPSKDKVYKEDDIGDLQGTKVYDPVTGEYRIERRVAGKVDTVKWQDVDENRFPPITTGTMPPIGGTAPTTPTPPTTGPTAPGGTYNVSLLLPFLSQRSTASGIDPNAYWGIHFYAGAKLAYQELERDGVKLNINVFDTEIPANNMNALLRKNELRDAHLVIGPYKREQVEQAAGFAKQNKTPLVVPHTAAMGIADNNPYYVQVNPSLKSHCEAIMRHVRKRHATENIVLVVRNENDEKARLKYFQDANAAIEGKREGSQMREFVVSGNYNNINVDSYIRRGRSNVFIVPSWASEPFVYSLLRQLMLKVSEGEDITVYGMPAWVDYEQVDFEYYERLNVHISSGNFINRNDERVRQFNRRFFDTYATIARDEAFIGYDIMLYFGKMINKYGREFPTYIDRENYDVLSGRFQFQRIVLEPEKHRENLSYYDQVENTFVHILQFKDYHFRAAD